MTICFLQRYTQKIEKPDLLNIECCHGDDVIDVRASANLLDIRQIPIKTKHN